MRNRILILTFSTRRPTSTNGFWNQKLKISLIVLRLDSWAESFDSFPLKQACWCWGLMTVFLPLCFTGSAWSQIPWRQQAQSLPEASIVLLGEQHDASEHQELARLSVESLTRSSTLSALVLEMADDGVNTEGLALNSTELKVRSRLKWNEAGWPWARYGPVVMQAVRAGVPVVGANLPFSSMTAVMRDERYDNLVPQAVLNEHRQRMVQGHCGLLPESQAPGMARIQIARDESMGKTAKKWVRNGKTVLVLAGAEHVKKDRGIPLISHSYAPHILSVVWMQATSEIEKDPSLSDLNWQTPPVPFKDHCAELAKAMKK